MLRGSRLGLIESVYIVVLTYTKLELVREERFFRLNSTGSILNLVGNSVAMSVEVTFSLEY